MQQLLTMTEFDAGARYADYNASTDKKAEYGLAGLVAAGGAAASLIVTAPLTMSTKGLDPSTAESRSSRSVTTSTAARGTDQPGMFLRVWCAMVGSGSRAAVALIRHI